MASDIEAVIAGMEKTHNVAMEVNPIRKIETNKPAEMYR